MKGVTPGCCEPQETMDSKHVFLKEYNHEVFGKALDVIIS